ncbi:V-type ATPase subunit [Treponema sp.]|uniref:V-type ATPase subunit n=1 Tax=Treponema sp. TaxID=166 RepID=UPI00388E2134
MMDKSAADSYVYAKASGMLARSYVGDKARDLFSLHSLQELWSFLFKKDVPVVPEALLARALETEAFDSFVYQYKKLIECYAEPKPVLTALLHGYDYENLKDIGAALSLKETKLPEINRVNPFNLIDYDKWPDLKAMTAGSPLEWYSSPVDIREQHLVNHKIDCQNVIEIIKAIEKTEMSCRKDIKKLISEKLIIDNIVWAIRLRLYYNMTREEIVPLLAYSTEEKKGNDYLVQDALKILDFPLDDYDSWKKWKYSSLLNPHEDGAVWTVDPRWISMAFKTVYVGKARRLFHQYPFTCCPMVCWFIIKQDELDNIRTASESLRLNIESAQAMRTVGIMEVNNG